MASTTNINGSAKEHTTEQLVAIHAAMMEELGISRKDSLALADKGFDNFAVNPQAIKKPIVATGLGAAWHNIEFDDVDPADDELDPIADGQLYRLRRGASYAAQQSFGIHRGGGGRANRGGRGNSGARGGLVHRGGHIPRGGYVSPSRGATSGTRHLVQRIPSQQPLDMQTFFNDARRGISARVRVDGIISDLRDEKIGSKSSRNKKAKVTTPVNVQPTVSEPPAVRGQVPISKPPKRPQPAIAWSLASSQDFLAHIGMNQGGRQVPSKTIPSRPTVQPGIQPSSTAQESASAEATINGSSHSLPTPADPRTQQLDSISHADRTTSSGPRLTAQPVAPQVSSLLQETSRSDHVNGSTLLSATAQTQVTNENRDPFINRQAAGLSTSRYATTLTDSKGKTKRQHDINVWTEVEGTQAGQARLITYTPTDNFYTLEVQVEDKIKVDKVLDDSVHFVLQAEEAIITFQAADGCQVWKLLFRMPYMAKNFYETVRPASRSPVLRSPALTVPTSGMLSSNAGSALAVTAVGAASKNQPAPISPLSVPVLAAPAIGVSRLIPEPAIEVTSPVTSQNHRPNEPSEIVMPEETCQSPFEERSETLVDFSLSPKNHSIGTNRISSSTFSCLAELDGVSPLISFSDNEEDDEEMGEAAVADSQALSAAMIEMLSADDSEQIKEILLKLDDSPDGNFLRQLSAEVTRHGVPAAERLTTEELRNSLWGKAYTLASEKIVSAFLSESETFKMLPDFISLMWVSDKSAKVLDLAISQRRRYPLKELLSYRKNAYEVRTVLLSKEDMAVSRGAQQTVFRSATLMPKPVVEASVPTTHDELPSVTRTPAPLVVRAPEAWKNYKPQETDMAKWEFILNNDRKPPSKAEKPVEPKETRPQLKGHVPSNSDYDRLAQTLEGFHMDLELGGHQGETCTGQASSNAAEPLSPDTICELAPPARPLSAASRVSTSASQPMTEKITNELAMPVTASPMVKTQITTMHTRLKAIECQVQSVSNNSAVSPAAEGSALPEMAIATTSEDVVATHDTSETVQHVTALASRQALSAPNSVDGHSGTNHSVVSADDSLAVNASPSVVDTGDSKESALTLKFTGQATQLKKGGLSVSRWATTASEPVSKRQTFAFSSGPTPQRLNPATAPVFQPAQPGLVDNFRNNFETSSQVPLGLGSPPMIPMQQGYVPFMATVITRDPYTGQFRETQGLLKTGSVPVIAHASVLSFGSPQNQENIPMGHMAPPQYTPGMQYNNPMPSFPARSDMHARHLSESSDSDQNFMPGLASNSLPPLGLRSGNAHSANIARSNGSSVHQGDDLQAKLQSRLNSSFANRQPISSPERN